MKEPCENMSNAIVMRLCRRNLFNIHRLRTGILWHYNSQQPITIQWIFCIYYNTFIMFSMVYDTACYFCALYLWWWWYSTMIQIWAHWIAVHFIKWTLDVTLLHLQFEPCLIRGRFQAYHSQLVDVYAFPASLLYIRWILNDALKAIYW